MNSTTTSNGELNALTATEMVAKLRAGEVRPREAVDAAFQQIEKVDHELNAIPTRSYDLAYAHAERIEALRGERADDPLWLAGLPVAIKDLSPVAGLRTTFGSPIYADFVPARSDLLVERLEAHGAIVIGKSNTPEFGAGASTFNAVFGTTRNPWDRAYSVAGSSGGSAAALASGEVWLAHGSDLGGSLRTPASFNGIVGLRPTPGRVARGLYRLPHTTPVTDTLMVEGPMARSALDCALMLDAMAGPNIEDPLSMTLDEQRFASQVAALAPPKRIAFSEDLGLMPVDREVREICRAAAARFSELGSDVVEFDPDFSGALECFQVLRALLFATEHREHLQLHRELLKPDVVWNIEKGLALNGEEIARAEATRLKIIGAAMRMFEQFDLLLCPAAIVPPFLAEIRYVEEVDGHRFDNYVDWLGITFSISLLGCPAASAPAGLASSGMPVGIQIVAPPRREAAVLSAAHHLESLTGLSKQLPRL